MNRVIIFIFSVFFIQAETIETYYKTGELKERIEVQNGIRNGLYQKWYLNGQLGKESSYKNGVLDGELITWYPNGVVKGVYPITDGKIQGTAKYYDYEGNLSWQVYENNLPNQNNKINLAGWCLD